MKFAKILKKSFEESSFFSYFCLFEIAFLLFYFLQNQLTFADPDSFYHVKMAMLIKENGIIREFPYLQYTILKQYFADHHFLYHLFLVPFVTILPPLVGVKLATITFSSLAIVVFYWVLKNLGAKGAGFYAFVLMTSASFVFRINLTKAQSLALIAYLLGLYFILKKKYYSLAVLSFLYVWLYGGWPLIYVLSGAYFISGIFLRYTMRQKFFGSRWKNILFGRHFSLNGRAAWEWMRMEYKIFFPVTVGVLAGLVINPFFPQNLFFYWYQIVKIAILGSKNVIGVGGEWYSYNPIELMASGSLAFIIVVVALTFFFLLIKKQNVSTVMLFLLTIFFFAITVKSRRNVEYLTPTMLLFSALALTIFSKEMDIKNFLQELRKFLKEQKILLAGVILPLILVPYVLVRDYFGVRKAYVKGLQFIKYQGAAEWLKKNTPERSIVFHSNWDEFPLLFYHNSRNYYLVGLDPTFMYNYDPELFEKWKNISLGIEKENMYKIIKNDFRAEYVFIDISRHEEMDKNMKNNFLFEEMFRDEKTVVYRVL